MRSQRSRGPDKHGMRRGQAQGEADRSFSRSPLFYLLLYLHLVVQVMGAGTPLGQRSTIAKFLVVEETGVGNEEEVFG